MVVKDVILKNKARLLHNGKLLPPAHEVWKLLKDEYSINKTPKALYTYVSCNSWNIKEDLFGNSNTTEAEEATDERCDDLREDSDDSCISDYMENSEEDWGVGIRNTTEQSRQPSTSFVLFIPKEKWKAIEPEERTYYRQTRTEPERNLSQRKYKVLKPGIWTDVFTDAVWKSLKWPCTWSFKGNYLSVRDDAKFWMCIRASCGCGNNFRITVPNPPPADPMTNGLTTQVSVWGSKQ